MKGSRKRVVFSSFYWIKDHLKHNQLTLKCTAWMHCKAEKKQKNQLAVKCTTRRSKLLKFIFRKKLLCNFLDEKWKLLIF